MNYVLGVGSTTYHEVYTVASSCSISWSLGAGHQAQFKCDQCHIAPSCHDNNHPIVVSHSLTLSFDMKQISLGFLLLVIIQAGNQISKFVLFSVNYLHGYTLIISEFLCILAFFCEIKSS